MWRPFTLGVVTGLRSQLPSAMLAWRASRGDLPAEVSGPAALLQRKSSLRVAAVAAAGEMVGDKLPQTPSRLDSGPFVGRLALGATAGAGLASAFGQSQVLGAAFGAAGAAVGSVAGYRLRAMAAERTPLPDLAWALVEDGVAITLALRATRTAG
jgi:uncharacterized membrane protein